MSYTTLFENALFEHDFNHVSIDFFNADANAEEKLQLLNMHIKEKLRNALLHLCENRQLEDPTNQDNNQLHHLLQKADYKELYSYLKHKVEQIIRTPKFEYFGRYLDLVGSSSPDPYSKSPDRLKTYIQYIAFALNCDFEEANELFTRVLYSRPFDALILHDCCIWYCLKKRYSYDKVEFLESAIEARIATYKGKKQSDAVFSMTNYMNTSDLADIDDEAYIDLIAKHFSQDIVRERDKTAWQEFDMLCKKLEDIMGIKESVDSHGKLWTYMHDASSSVFPLRVEEYIKSFETGVVEVNRKLAINYSSRKIFFSKYENLSPLIKKHYPRQDWFGRDVNTMNNEHIKRRHSLILVFSYYYFLSVACMSKAKQEKLDYDDMDQFLKETYQSCMDKVKKEEDPFFIRNEDELFKKIEVEIKGKIREIDEGLGRTQLAVFYRGMVVRELSQYTYYDYDSKTDQKLPSNHPKKMEQIDMRIEMWEDYQALLNSLLVKCGLSPLYWGNPFDAIFMICLMEPSPLGAFYDFIQTIEIDAINEVE